ncbi:MAG: response regulator [Deltaproteobacteria bacterium]|nr:response regulator [Deltaproteobacteria bacterium]
MAINLLVVDDSGVMRAMVLKTMRMAGLSLAEVHEAANGQEGLHLLENHWIDLAIVDINMPVMNGEEMIDQMKGNPELKDIPVVVISTEGSKARIERLQHKGVNFIHKPFSAEAIRDTVMHLLKMEDSDDGTIE